jgi:alcohol dehydrogenase class IV
LAELSAVPTCFTFATAARIVFGQGCSTQIPEELTGMGSRVLLCTGSRPERHAELTARIPLPITFFPVSGEPHVAMVRAAVETGREHRADLVIAVGGGSVIDLAKAAAALLPGGNDPLEHLEVVGRGRPITSSLPCVAVPTTAGTGAEVTANAVLASPEHRVKVSMRSPMMLPRVAVVDPQLTVGCPPSVTAFSGLDALTQCLEPYVSARATPITDALAREGLRRAARGLTRAHADAGDIEARTDMALCSLFGGMSLANAKLGAVHALAGVMGGLVDVPHGLACALLLAPVAEMNVRVLREREPDSASLDRYTEVAKILTGCDEARIEDGLGWIRETVRLLCTRSFADFALAPEDAAHIIPAALRASSMQGNPLVVTAEDLGEVLAEVL